MDGDRAEASWSRSSSTYSLPPPHSYPFEIPHSRASSMSEAERVEIRSRSSSLYSLATHFPTMHDVPHGAARSRSSSTYSFPPPAVHSPYDDDDVPPSAHELAARTPTEGHPYYWTYFPNKAYAIEPTYAFAPRAEPYGGRREDDAVDPFDSTYRVRYPRPPEIA